MLVLVLETVTAGPGMGCRTTQIVFGRDVRPLCTHTVPSYMTGDKGVRVMQSSGLDSLDLLHDPACPPQRPH